MAAKVTIQVLLTAKYGESSLSVVRRFISPKVH